MVTSFKHVQLGTEMLNLISCHMICDTDEETAVAPFINMV